MKIQAVNLSDSLTSLVSPSILAAKITPISKNSKITRRVNEQTITNLKINTSGGIPLSSYARFFFEPRFGVNLQKVRIHQDGDAAKANQVLNSDAFTYGSHIWLNQGIFFFQSLIDSL